MAKTYLCTCTLQQIKFSNLKVLETESYIDSYVIEQENNPKQNIKVFLKYKGWWIKKAFIFHIKKN